MKKLLNKQLPYYIILLPVFFVMHSWNSFYYLIKFKDILWVLLAIILPSALLFGTCLLILKNSFKAGILSFLTTGYMLFYGYIYDQLQHYAQPLSRHSILVVILIVFFIVTFLILSKKDPSSLQKLNSFFNILLITLCIYEFLYAGVIAANINSSVETTNITANKKRTNPNIYLLVFDEYASTKSLKRDYGYDNSNLDSFLISKKFFVMKDSKSNYLRTNLSIASLLNFDYTSGMNPRSGMSANDLLKSHKQIKYNAFFSIGKKNGYEIYNYTIFDTELSPSKVKNEYLFNNERIIISSTMICRLINDVGPSLQIRFLKKILGTDITTETYRRYNERAVNLFLKDLENNTNQSPKLSYAHFLMPHPPFLYDSLSNPVHFDEEKMENYYSKKFVPDYLNYLPYTNQHLKTIINTILTVNNNNCIILVMGDHGYKVMDDNTLSPDHFFNNLQALYLPSGVYTPLKQTSTPINVMRHLINQAFNQKLPFLVDSAILLGNKW